ncbi:hypothetical protein B0F90DRAFT_1811880 [Multifurca ochricompacta]|uniref:Protein LCHN n=1 Tax=Multifurca ochricompacta TaxID=376703 RepID=A0AAD4LYI1_9AGAM|nr:hypothetical protein B0F90DRAFT_1811880 [Multifurca ochricompacta]
MATSSTSASKKQLPPPPQDIVAIFHASFHPTRGNILDWSLKASDDLQLDGVEFSSLPSGLHLVEQDVVYFTKDTHHGVSIFRRRQTSEHGQRGFRLSSLGILLAPSARPRPWRHVPALKALARDLHATLDARRGVNEPPQEEEDDWASVRRFFELRKVLVDARSGSGSGSGSLGGGTGGAWRRWSEELDGASSHAHIYGHSHASPTLHLPHLLRILGPSSLTLYKHVLGRRRILIYTQPPVEFACFICQVAADMCFEDQTQTQTTEATAESNDGNDPDDGRFSGAIPQMVGLNGKQKEGINVLGIVTLHDIGVLERESTTGRGWIACTTDAVFLEKPQYYDLVIDMTTFSPERAYSRPSLQLSVKEPSTLNGRVSRKPSYRLSTIRFTWSDVKLWNELDRILQLDADANTNSSSSFTRRAPPAQLWRDAWRLYEDACLVCAGLWAGAWPSNGNNNNNNNNGNNSSGDGRRVPRWAVGGQGQERGFIDGTEADDATVQVKVRARGEGIEGRPMTNLSYRRPSRRYAPSNAQVIHEEDIGKYEDDNDGGEVGGEGGGVRDDGDGDNDGELGEGVVLVRSRQSRTTLALLQTFHAQTRFLLSRLASVLSSHTAAAAATTTTTTTTYHHHPNSDSDPGGDEYRYREPGQITTTTIQLTLRDVALLELGPFSSLDARFVEWLAAEYFPDARVFVRRGWRDILGLVFPSFV